MSRRRSSRPGAGKASDANALFRKAGEAFAGEDWPGAEKLLLRVLALHPDHPVCLNNLGFVQHLQGRSEEAGKAYRRALSLEPDYADARLNLAKALLALGRSDEAEAELRELLARHPRQVDALNELGNLSHASGRAGEALAHYRRALELDPRHVHAWWNLAEVLRAEGELAEAADAYRNHLALDPARAEGWLALGQVQLERGASEEATAAFARGAECAADDTAFWRGLGEAWLGARNWRGALAAFRTARESAPFDPGIALGLARAHFDAGDLEEAEQVAQRSAQAQSDPHERAALLNFVGVVRMARENAAEAEVAFRESLRDAPGLAAAHNNLGLALGAQGRREDAQASYRRAIEFDPDYGEAYRNLSHSLRCRSLDEPLPRAIADLLQRDLPVQARMQLHFALAKQCDDCGEYDAAFANYAKGNAIHFARYPFDLEAFRAHVARLAGFFDRAWFARRDAPPDPSERPVFVVGMPRSGTTLTEQVIAAHAQGGGRSELRKIEQLVFEMESGGGAYPESLAGLGPERLVEMAAAYRAELERGLDPLPARIVDKMPFNFLHLGLITTLFPNAHVVHCERDPLDTCLSNFFQVFPSGAEYSYDLAALGRYYREYRRVMAHWDGVLPRPPFRLRYESMIEDPEGVTRALLDYLGLDWDPACLEFHRARRNVSTLSTWQVRQPLYSSSVARWRNYERHLGPLREALGE